MKKISLILLVFFCSSLFSQPPNGSKSLLHTQTARTFESGRLELHSGMNFFTRVTEFVGSGQKPQNFSANNYWLVVGHFNLTYGLMDNLDLTIAPRVYQDTHYSNSYNLPDDIFVTLKGGSFAFGKRRFYGSLMTNFRFGTGEQHNYPFVEYASGALEYGFTGALSYFIDPYLPERALNAHLNLGWWNHNEAGEVLYKFKDGTTLKGSKNSSELQYALGVVYPTALFDYRLEMFGTAFITEPDEFVYSRENYLYMTPSIQYKAIPWLTADLGVDIRLTSDENTTNYNIVPEMGSRDYNLPNYCSWRVHMGLNLTILPLSPSKRSAAEVEKDEFNKRVEFFQKIVEDRQRSEDLQEELERLKKEREAAEKELEELKQIMQEEE